MLKGEAHSHYLMPMKRPPYQILNEAAYHLAYQEALDNTPAFWAGVAENFSWKKKWDNVLDWDFESPSVQWFDGGRLNITDNCLDRHAKNQPDAVALVWEANDPSEPSRSYTYKALLTEVEATCHAMSARGITKGDRVCLYMGMVPELAIAVLACARMGVIHSVIFGGFSAESVKDRVIDTGSVALMTCDAAHRGTKTIPLFEVVDEAIKGNTTVHTVFVLNRCGIDTQTHEGRDVPWAEAVNDQRASGPFASVDMASEDPLFILYTSGSTGAPKGIVHTTAGYMVWSAYTFANVFQCVPGHVHFCTADIGWITGHSYIVYGPLLLGSTTVMFEGIPTHPTPNRFWEIVEKHKVNSLYTAPTAIRALMHCGHDGPRSFAMESLTSLGTVGEPINESAWHWYNDEVGKGDVPIVDTWWQTETGGIMVSNLSGITASKPTFATTPLPGVYPVIVDTEGTPIEGNDIAGLLCIEKPWPGMMRTIWGSHERCKQTYFSMFPGKYFTGDGCVRDKDGHYRITGRVDDVLNVSGHRIGTAEVENAINRHPNVVESAVVGVHHDIKGQGIHAFVIVNSAFSGDIETSIKQEVTTQIGAIARPESIQVVEGLPKTRSGKIMRRILRKISEGDFETIGDTSTLLNPSVVDSIIKNRVSKEGKRD